MGRYQKGKINLDFTEARDSKWQWHQLGYMQVCTSLQTDNHASTPPLKFFYRPDALPAAQPTASKHWRQVRVSICIAHNNQESQCAVVDDVGAGAACIQINWIANWNNWAVSWRYRFNGSKQMVICTLKWRISGVLHAKKHILCTQLTSSSFRLRD